MNTVDLAKDIVSLCRKHNYEIGKTKIHKLLYLFLGFSLMNNVIDEQNQFDELPKAWPYGPVFENVYEKYDAEILNTPTNHHISVEGNLKTILEQTVEKWGKVSGGRLSDWSHEEDGPWYEIIQKNRASWKTEIPLHKIESYFSNVMKNVI